MNVESKYQKLLQEQAKAEKAINPFMAASYAKSASKIAVELLGFLLAQGGYRG
ncbi:hypothetical protein [Photobacterium kishitanii]|uniref:hypothetical protein n=1 Tax=Photobacterium kishitanii TaxID=318456 RepID=UPI000A666971|nr:hypothetical protein [Photobacterium kishitanii]